MLWQLAASGWALAVGVTDWRIQRIPNWLLLPGLLLAVIATVGAGAPAGWRSALLAAGIALALLLPGYLLGKTGAGDVKCLMVMGACVGVVGVIELFLAASGLLGAACAIRLRRQRAATAGPALPEQALDLPMGPALVAGFLLVVWSGPLLMPGVA